MKPTKQEKEWMKQAFAVPVAKEKRAFLRSLPRPDVGIGDLMLSQAPYIRKWVWLASAAVFVTAVCLAKYLAYDMLWILSSFMPFVALSVVLELAKSSACGMAELEMTSRFSLRTILLARMSMIGMVQFFVLILMAALLDGTGLLKGLWSNVGTMARSGVYLLVPYLLTTVLGLMAVRRIHGKESSFACGSISAFVSVLNIAGSYFISAFYEEKYTGLWILAAVCLGVKLGKEFKKTTNQMEELA